MPAAAIPIITAIIGAAGVGTSIYSLTNKPSAPKPATPTPAQTTATAADTQKTQEAALSQEFPNIQAATGGSLSPDAWIKLAEMLSGQAGAPGIGGSSQDLLMKIFGKGGSAVNVGTPTSGSAAGPGLTPAGSTFG